MGEKKDFGAPTVLGRHLEIEKESLRCSAVAFSGEIERML